MGRFIHADECTVDKARLDFTRILISTPIIEIVNTSQDFLIDDCKYAIKMVEEWGCCLGEDAFLFEEESEIRPAATHNVDDNELEEIQGE